MSKLTGKEIIEKLAASHLTVSNFAYEELPYLPEDEVKLKEFGKGKKWDDPELSQMRNEYSKKADQFFKDLVGDWTEKDQHGGEGEGDNWWSIKYFPDHDVYIKVHGYYQSHYGTDFGSWNDAVREVKPAEKTITVYE